MDVRQRGAARAMHLHVDNMGSPASLTEKSNSFECVSSSLINVVPNDDFLLFKGVPPLTKQIHVCGNTVRQS